MRLGDRAPAGDVVVGSGRPPADPRAPSDDASGPTTATGAAAMATLRWAFAFYGGFSFLALGTLVATWIAP